MTDVVTRLRWARWAWGGLATEAAKEIERLRYENTLYLNRLKEIDPCAKTEPSE
jgi:hypothetical protein